jgi:hypothetical protein
LRSPCAKKAAGLLRDPDRVREHAPNWGGAWPAPTRLPSRSLWPLMT